MLLTPEAVEVKALGVLVAATNFLTNSNIQLTLISLFEYYLMIWDQAAKFLKLFNVK